MELFLAELAHTSAAICSGAAHKSVEAAVSAWSGGLDEQAGAPPRQSCLDSCAERPSFARWERRIRVRKLAAAEQITHGSRYVEGCTMVCEGSLPTERCATVVLGAGATPSGEGECDQVKKGVRQETRGRVLCDKCGCRRRPEWRRGM